MDPNLYATRIRGANRRTSRHCTSSGRVLAFASAHIAHDHAPLGSGCARAHPAHSGASSLADSCRFETKRLARWLAVATRLAVLCVLSTTVSRADPVLLYDVDFGTPPHVVGQPPVIAWGSVPRETPTSINFGDARVVAQQGVLADQPCAFGNGTTGYDQIQFATFHTGVPSYERYHVEIQVLVDTLVYTPLHEGFAVIVDVPWTLPILFHSNKTILVNQPVATYSFDVPVLVEVDLDFPADSVRVSIDGVPAYSDSLDLDYLYGVRLHLAGRNSADQAAVDNLRIYGDGLLPVGACCLNGAMCVQYPRSACEAQDGVYIGDGVPCEPTTCLPQANGACCLPDGTCVIRTAVVCAAEGGVYQGDGTSCAPNPCFPDAAVCCCPDGSCTITPQPQCLPPCVWYPQWMICDPDLCPTSSAPTAGTGTREGLLGAVPNPFSASAILWYRLAKMEHVRLEIFDADGHRVQSRELGDVGAGVHSYEWDGCGPRGNPVAPGIYFARLSAGGQSWTRTAIRIK
jgi:hypothetical protein